MAVKAVLTYEISEAAAALNKSPATIRSWIKDGLPVMASQKPYLLLGADIRSYLQSKSRDAKSPLEETELFCPACKTGHEPVDMRVTQQSFSPKTTLLKGTCSQCSATATRIVSTPKLPDCAKIFNFEKGGESDA